MLHGEILAVWSEIHAKHINILYGQNFKFLLLNLVLHKVTASL
jgi:hypothetical protein